MGACFIKDRSRAFRSAEPSRRVELEEKGNNRKACRPYQGSLLYIIPHHKGDRQPPIVFSPLSPDSLSDVPLSLRLYSLHHARFLADMTFVTNRDEGHLTWLVIEVARNINHMHQVYNCLLKIWGTDPLPAFPQELIRKWAEPQVRTKRGTELALHFIDTCYVGSVKCNFFGCPCVNFSLTDLRSPISMQSCYYVSLSRYWK